RPHPVLEVANTGTIIRDGLCLAASGTLIYGRGSGRVYRLEVECLDFSTQADTSHIEQLRDSVSAEQPAGTQVIDFRGGAVRTYSVGEAPARQTCPKP
ncbi:MAG TPA: hypothetical protein P5572_13025, partial [Phycisphaerae bacterium]|nr:hypothetical protein [Phycisphaerae bacterium]